MVRTLSSVVPAPIEVSRVLGWSTALALHMLALMLLLIPAAYVATPLPRDRMQVRLLAEPAPVTPPPPVLTEPVPMPPMPTVVQRQTAPLPAPTASAEDSVAVAPLPASEVQAPSLLPPAPVPAATGGEGAQLQYRSAPPPPYPVAALRNHEQGTVLLRVRVDADGAPASVVIERSSGSRALDQAARQQVLRHWRFVPARVDGQAVPADGLVPVSFSLPD